MWARGSAPLPPVSPPFGEGIDASKTSNFFFFLGGKVSLGMGCSRPTGDRFLPPLRGDGRWVIRWAEVAKETVFSLFDLGARSRMCFVSLAPGFSTVSGRLGWEGRPVLGETFQENACMMFLNEGRMGLQSGKCFDRPVFRTEYTVSRILLKTCPVSKHIVLASRDSAFGPT